MLDIARDGKRRFVLPLIAVLMMVAPAMATGSAPAGAGERAAPLDLPGPDPAWSDELDDLSGVYVPSGGLVGLEVAGGEAHLLPGSDEGWIASEVITCPRGHRYDVVVLDVITPGDSHVEVSILNASKESTVVGYANETIPPFVDVTSLPVDLSGLDPVEHPEIRVQVDLFASGADRPVLRAWSLRYIDLDSWRDDLLGTSKLVDARRVVVDGGLATLDLASFGPSAAWYDPYPPILTTRTSQPSSFDALYPKPAGDGYEDATAVACTGSLGVGVADLDGDGFLDVVCANSPHGGQDKDSQIYWGSASGTWSPTGATNLATVGAERVATGDFDGDGDTDVLITCLRTSATVDTVVFLSRDGAFVRQPDIVLTQDDPREAAAGDLDGDGRDDIVLAEDGTSRCFLGGASGPDTTADVSFQVGTNCDEVRIRDLDGDGHLDVMFATLRSGKALVFLGGPDGPDNTPDYSLSVPGSRCYGCGSGDMNGDGYTDLVFTTSTTTLRVFEGSEAGWSDADVHDVTAPGSCRVADMLDIDRDGYDDLVAAGGGKVAVFAGGTTWPTSAAFTKDIGATTPPDMAIAVPARGASKYRGVMTTRDITLPQGKKWDLLYLDAALPVNTSASVTVLDSTGKAITGYIDLPGPDVDLSGILPERHRTLRVRVTLESGSNLTTPVVDTILVRWQDLGTWRDELYGTAKVDRMLGLDVVDNQLMRATPGVSGPQLVVASLRSDSGYDAPSTLRWDEGGLTWPTVEPLAVETRGASAVAVGDANGDGLPDLAFAVRGKSDTVMATSSPLFLGTPLGIRSAPDHLFPTTGASDVLLADLDADGFVDVVFAQEMRGPDDYAVDSTLFWGSEEGWNSTPDVEFATRGASGVAAADLDGDGDIDLAFSCYRDAASTSTDSMVFLQEAAGFCGTVPDHRLPTQGARAVAVGDLDGDLRTDLVFANSFAGGFTEIDSFVYLGRAGGGFYATPLGLPTVGAEDVLVDDLDGDGDLDLAFANQMDSSRDRRVDSYVYLNGGAGSFPDQPSARLPTVGATAVASADLDGTGRRDLVFACGSDGTTRAVPSLVYLGGASGWPASPDARLPTVGASDVAVARLVPQGSGGYLSQVIVPEDPPNTGTFHTLSYTASLGGPQACALRVVDADTWAVLAETQAIDGAAAWSLAGAFRVRDHPAVRVMALFTGLHRPGEAALADLHLNWTPRAKLAPRVLDLTLGAASLYRTQGTGLVLNVSDEYDLPGELAVTLEHRVNTTSAWETYLLGALEFRDGSWRTTVLPRVDAALGTYDLRVNVVDTDGGPSGWVVFPNVLEVRNNLPTAPVVRINPEDPPSTSTLNVEFVSRATDVERPGLSYVYAWFRDGELVEGLATDFVPSSSTRKGENWTVEVRAFDEDDLGPPASAWVVIRNAPPVQRSDLPDPEIDEDTPDDQWLDLSGAFTDPDDDPLTWSIAAEPGNLTVTIDPATGRVTLTPRENWHGTEDITFVASDGEGQATQVVTVTVLPVNDLPVIARINGAPPTGDPMSFTVAQNGRLVITYTVSDVEGDDIQADVSVTTVTLDEAAGTITFEPGDTVGTFTFTLRVWDVVEPNRKVSLGFTIEVLNANDPMDVPQINRPATGSKYKVNETFSLVGECFDPDVQHGQVLTFTWTSNISGLLGTGASITVKLLDEGTHLITLTVSDGEFERSTTIEVIIEASHVEPPPPPDDDDDGVSIPWALIVGIIAALVVLGIVMFVFVGKRKTDEFEREMDELEEAETKKEALERTRDAIRDLADRWEEEAVDGEAVARAEAAGWEVEGHGGPAPEGTVAPAEVATPPLPPRSEEELRLDELKRSYQNAIGRLPFGVPSRELAGRDWVELAGLLATGERMTSGDGAELTAIEGRWYHSDPDDTDTFLREYREPRAEPPPDAPDVDRERLLAKLEERLILGEISEESYNELRRKYGG